MDLSIGELSQRTGVKVATIRYYEQIGLLPEPPRTEGQQRRYGRGALQQLAFIRHARDLGFEIEDIRSLLELSAEPQRPCAEVDAIATRHLDAVERRIEQLSSLRSELQRMLRQCRANRIGNCRIIEVLSDHELCESESHAREPVVRRTKQRQSGTRASSGKSR